MFTWTNTVLVTTANKFNKIKIYHAYNSQLTNKTTKPQQKVKPTL